MLVDASSNLLINCINRIRKIDPNGVITTFAGNGIGGYKGDGGQATNAEFSFNIPSGMIFDAAGNLYVADTSNERVRKIATNGIVSTVAGTGTAGYNEDGIAAKSAELYYPFDVAFDPAGNLIIEDAANNRIREVTPDGLIHTIAGTGGGAYTGDGGPATNAMFFNPQGGLAVDASNNIYIGEGYAEHVRKINPQGIINSILGNGQGDFSGDGGPATNANLSYPLGVGCDAFGDVFIVGDDRVRKVNANGIISNLAGAGGDGYYGSYAGDGGPATNAFLGDPGGVTADAFGNVYVADEGNSRIRRIDTNGIITTVAGNGKDGYSGDNGAATNAELWYPYGVAATREGALYIADTGNNRLRMVNTNRVITTLDSALNSPEGVCVDALGNVFVADTGNNRIEKVATNRTMTLVAGNGDSGSKGDGGLATAAELNSPTSVAVDASGNVFIADYGNNRIRKVNTNGIITTVAGTNYFYAFLGDGGPATAASVGGQNVAVDAAGNLYIADTYNNRVRKVTP